MKNVCSVVCITLINFSLHAQELVEYSVDTSLYEVNEYSIDAEFYPEPTVQYSINNNVHEMYRLMIFPYKKRTVMRLTYILIMEK